MAGMVVVDVVVVVVVAIGVVVVVAVAGSGKMMTCWLLVIVREVSEQFGSNG